MLLSLAGMRIARLGRLEYTGISTSIAHLPTSPFESWLARHRTHKCWWQYAARQPVGQQLFFSPIPLFSRSLKRTTCGCKRDDLASERTIFPSHHRTNFLTVGCRLGAIKGFSGHSYASISRRQVAASDIPISVPQLDLSHESSVA